MTAPSPVPPLAAETSRVSAGPVHATRTASPASGRWEQRGVGDAAQRERARPQPSGVRQRHAGRHATPSSSAKAAVAPADRDRPGAAQPVAETDRVGAHQPTAHAILELLASERRNRLGGGATALPPEFDGPPGARDAATARQAELNGCEYKSFSLQSRPIKECAPGLVRTAFRSTRCRRAQWSGTPGRVLLRTPVSRRQWGNQSSLHWKHC